MDNSKKEKFLPIGSVVLLKGGTKKAMVTGFCSVAQEDKTKMYDYTGCVYPEGYLDFNQICLFDHDQIDQVFHYGYVDEEETDFKKELEEIATQFANGDEKMISLITDIEEDSDDETSDSIIPNLKEEKNNTVEELEYL